MLHLISVVSNHYLYLYLIETLDLFALQVVCCAYLDGCMGLSFVDAPEIVEEYCILVAEDLREAFQYEM